MLFCVPGSSSSSPSLSIRTQLEVANSEWKLVLNEVSDLFFLLKYSFFLSPAQSELELEPEPEPALLSPEFRIRYKFFPQVFHFRK